MRPRSVALANMARELQIFGNIDVRKLTGQNGNPDLKPSKTAANVDGTRVSGFTQYCNAQNKNPLLQTGGFCRFVTEVPRRHKTEHRLREV